MSNIKATDLQSKVLSFHNKVLNPAKNTLGPQIPETAFSTARNPPAYRIRAMTSWAHLAALADAGAAAARSVPWRVRCPILPVTSAATGSCARHPAVSAEVGRR